MKIVENTKQKWKSQNKSLWLKGLFRDSQTPSWLSEFRTDVPGELPAPKTKDYNMDISHFSAKHARLRSQSKDLLARDLDVCCFRGYYVNPTKRVDLVQRGHHHHHCITIIISLNCNLFMPGYTWKIVIWRKTTFNHLPLNLVILCTKYQEQLEMMK